MTQITCERIKISASGFIAVVSGITSLVLFAGHYYHRPILNYTIHKTLECTETFLTGCPYIIQDCDRLFSNCVKLFNSAERIENPNFFFESALPITVVTYIAAVTFYRLLLR